MSTSTEKTKTRPRRRTTWLFVAAIGAVALVTLGITALAINILDRQNEGESVAYTVTEITDDTSDPAEWGKNFPLQYEGWKGTTEMKPTKYGGARPVEIPMANGETRVGAESRIENDPRLITMWSGYGFAVDYREARGHAYMLEDQRLTRRATEFVQPGVCLNCHASTYNVMKDLGNGDVNAGFVQMNKMPYAEATQLAEHTVGCIDCHDPETMALRVTRPAFVEGMKQLKASEGVTDYDVNRDATPAEMRSFVCGQCHVEYYFEGDDKTLKFPWAKGLKVEQIMDESADHVDFTHITTGTKVLKAQHPEFDLSQQGVHAASGVSCSDCHMPYDRVGATKITDHKIDSPMFDVNSSCQTCHNQDEAELKQRVESRQDQFVQTRDRSMDAFVALVHDLELAQTNGTPEERINLARQYHRVASFYNDYLYSENSYGFHAPAEAQRIFADAIDAARKGQLALQGKHTEPPTQQGPDQSGPAPSPMPSGQTSTPTISPLPSIADLKPLHPTEAPSAPPPGATVTRTEQAGPETATAPAPVPSTDNTLAPRPTSAVTSE